MIETRSESNKLYITICGGGRRMVEGTMKVWGSPGPQWDPGTEQSP